MTSHRGDTPGGSEGSSRNNPSGAQGASRGGFQPDDSAGERRGRSQRDDSYYGDPRRRAGGSAGPPFGGYPFGSRRSRGPWSFLDGGGATFLGLPVTLIYAIGAAIIGIVLIGSVWGGPTGPGTVAGQVKALSTERTVSTLAGAEITLRGGGQTYTATSTDADPQAEGEAAYNYRFEDVPAGTYAMSVMPPAGANLQPEEDITLEVRSGQLFPQSVMLLAQGIQKPRPLGEHELQPGEDGGYINERGERVAYQQGGFDANDALLMYLLWRNPPGWGYGAPPIIVNSPGSTTGSNYRVAEPPSRTSSGQTVTQRRPSTPGQGSTRPSSSTGATGSAPSRGSSGFGDTDAVRPSTGSSGASSGSNTGSTTVTQPRAPSQGASRPSSIFSPSRSSAPSRSSVPSRSIRGGRR